jgi:hypothetical protein
MTSSTVKFFSAHNLVISYSHVPTSVIGANDPKTIIARNKEILRTF